MARAHASPSAAIEVASVLPAITAAAAALFALAGRVVVPRWRAPLLGPVGYRVAGAFLLGCALVNVGAVLADRRNVLYPLLAVAYAWCGLGALRTPRSADPAARATRPALRWPGALALSLVIGLQLAVAVAWWSGVARAQRMLPEAPEVR